MRLVIDANIAVKWHIQQERSEAARALGGPESRLIAPEFILAELASALRKYVKSGEVAADAAEAILQKSPLAFEALFPLEPLTIRAFKLAIAINHPIYDCYYLALAEREAAALVTADLKLAKAARDLPGVEVRTLGAERL